ncbi:multiple epidermal growth factor-like domains protein 6 [Ostrea edulis]|uniref:multiple epidermal growth factor-like domains protein 6 n=1 Tax=Ostrea edulis TaxID=37623 RepID=UPI0024AFFDD0|nr:multiple epidermal growth factor-like domains protein 6 [Ostrea edulis]
MTLYGEILSQKRETEQANEVPGCQQTGTCQKYKSSRAVDGDINTCTRTAPIGRQLLDEWAWWYIDLEKVISIYSIRIQFKGYGEQYGCKNSGVYGYNCDLPCPNNCQELRCDIVNGSCLGCNAGWVGDLCNKSCPAGYYGLRCRSTCTGHCRDNLSCNHTTGQCDYGCECPAESYGPDCMFNCSGQCLSYLPCNRTTGRCDGGCNLGYTRELCDKECPPGTYGPDCLNVCNVTNGCNPGYTKEICDKEILSQNKETEQAEEVTGCQETGTCQQYQSIHAVDGKINTCTRTAKIGTPLIVPDKWTWWYINLEKVLSIYSIRIQFKDYGEQYVRRQRGRFAGFSLYVSNTTIKEDGYLCYKNGQELPALDFSTTCVKHGRYVIFYNERLDGTTYPTGYQIETVFTELCEVTVTGCEESGVYGYNCDLPCPYNCQESRCDIVNGTCLGCTAGWVGEFCNKSCPARYYGLQCGSTCTGHCRDNVSCNHTTGQCDYGCDNGWTGTHCNTECPAESYGPDCVYNCSGQCLSYLPCNRATGRCDGGCNSGYTGELCDKG